MLYLSGMKKLEQILSYHIEGGAGAYKKLYDDIESYTKECVKASLEKASENATMQTKYPDDCYEDSEETGLKTASVHDIDCGGEDGYVEIEKESITSEENIILL